MLIGRFGSQLVPTWEIQTNSSSSSKVDIWLKGEHGVSPIWTRYVYPIVVESKMYFMYCVLFLFHSSSGECILWLKRDKDRLRMVRDQQAKNTWRLPS